MAYAHFISETYLKNNSPVAGNISMSEVYPFCRSAEETYIQEALGSKLYDRLVESLNASPKNTTDDETDLLLKVRPAVMWYALYDALPFLDIKIRNIGLVRQGGDNLQNVGREDVSYLRKICKDKGDFYLKRVQDYLCENASLFTQYRGGTWGASDMYPNPNVSNSSDVAIDRNDPTYKGGYDTDFARKWLSGG